MVVAMLSNCHLSQDQVVALNAPVVPSNSIGWYQVCGWRKRRMGIRGSGMMRRHPRTISAKLMVLVALTALPAGSSTIAGTRHLITSVDDASIINNVLVQRGIKNDPIRSSSARDHPGQAGGKSQGDKVKTASFDGNDHTPSRTTGKLRVTASHEVVGSKIQSAKRVCNHPVCRRAVRGNSRGSKPLEFDFNLVFNCVVIFSNAVVLLGAALMRCSLCSCSGWLSAFILVNVLCPGIVVIIDTLPAELGTYLLMVICESLVWLGVAVWRLRDSFQKQSEFILALLLYSLCTSYVAWSGPALYVEVLGGTLDSRLGVLVTMLVQALCYLLLERVLQHERTRTGDQVEARGRSSSPERDILSAPLLESVTTKFLLAGDDEDKNASELFRLSKKKWLHSPSESFYDDLALDDVATEFREGNTLDSILVGESQDRKSFWKCDDHVTAGKCSNGQAAVAHAAAAGSTASEGMATTSCACDSCAVCTGRLECGEEVRRLDWCGHVFHAACIDPWLLRHSARCPLCRRFPRAFCDSSTD